MNLGGNMNKFKMTYIEIISIQKRIAWNIGLKTGASCNLLDFETVVSIHRKGEEIYIKDFINKIKNNMISENEESIDFIKYVEDQIEYMLYEFLYLKYDEKNDFDVIIKIDENRNEKIIYYTEIFYSLFDCFEPLYMKKIITIDPEIVLSLCNKIFLDSICEEKCYIFDKYHLYIFIERYLKLCYNHNKGMDFYKIEKEKAIENLKNKWIKYITDILNKNMMIMYE